MPADGRVHVEHIVGGQGDLRDTVEAGMKPRRDVSADGGFAAVDFTGHEADTAQLDQMSETGFGFAASVRGVKLVGFEGILEGKTGEGGSAADTSVALLAEGTHAET